MSAKEITVFFPLEFHAQPMLEDMVRLLALRVDQIAPEKKLGYQFSAQKGSGEDYLLMEYKKNDEDVIDDISGWESPGEKFKKALEKCQSSVTLYYRDLNIAKEAVGVMGGWLEEFDLVCIFDNGLGCLLTLNSVVDHMGRERGWSWERTVFPELPDVADSEWI